MKKLLLLLALSIGLRGISAQEITPEVQKKAQAILEQMTLDEKIDYISGINNMYLKAIPRLSIPSIRMSDGPQGVNIITKSTLYPSGIVSAASWDRDLVYKVGTGIGMDCRARGINFILGPAVNIYRAPYCGRNFEYFGEDPYLAGETAKQYILGVQSQGVAATIKHFAGNNQDYERNHVSSDIDERTLHEIYLPAFRKAVREAQVGAVMSSYNLLNGVHTSEDPYLNIEVLRNQWGYEGILMSDWWSVHSTVNTLNAGLDLEMPGNSYFKADVIKQALKNGTVTEKTIDTKIQHILQTLIAFHFFDRDQKDGSLPEKNPVCDQIALEAARGGIVMLKNEDHILPLAGKKIIVLGDNAALAPKGGGSGNVNPFYAVSILEGMKNLKKPRLKVDVMPEARFCSDMSATGEFFTEKSMKVKGFKAEYFKNRDCSGTPDQVQTESFLSHDWDVGSPLEGFPVDNFSIRYTAVYKPAKSKQITFKGSGDDGYRLYINDELVFEDWGEHAFTTRQKTLEVEAGKTYDLRFEYFDANANANAVLAYFSDDDEALQKRLAKADVAVVCVGFTNNIEGEGFDRPFELPYEQSAFIQKVCKYHKNVVVIINAGGGVDMMPWIDDVKGVLMAWYPGQEGGNAMAEILAGKISPTGKLPISIEKVWGDNPACESYHDDPKAIERRVMYSEGIFGGYRGYDRNEVEPLFPFGYGLTYTTFDYSDLKLVKKGDHEVMVTFKLKNTGRRDAAEVAQVYVSDPECRVVRPVKELKGYEKVFLKKGEVKEISILLNEEAFSFYDTDQHRFVIEPGQFNISVGASSRDIRLKESIEL